jgi:integrase
MGVYRRTDNKADGTSRERWQIRFTFRHPDGRTERIRRTLPVGTRKRDAESIETEMRAALAAGTYNTYQEPDPAPVFAEFAEHWLETYARSQLKPSTAKGYASSLRQILPHFEGVRIHQIDAASLDRYIAACRQDGQSAKTIQNRLGVLYKVLGTAVEYGKLDAAHLPSKRKVKVPKPQVEFLTDAELTEILDAASEDPLLHALITVAANTGLRRGELFGLEWDVLRLDGTKREVDVTRSYDRGVVTTPKSNQYRTVPLNTVASRTFRDLLPGKRAKGPVFVDAQGDRWTPERVKNRLRSIARATGRDALGWHIFRHTFATRLVRKGVALNVVQQLLGHSDIRMTLRYAHVTQTDKAAAVDLLEV